MTKLYLRNREMRSVFQLVYDYNQERDQYEKGTMLDEFYLKELVGGREEVKQTVRDKYCSDIALILQLS
jgi:hypothetical protein